MLRIKTEGTSHLYRLEVKDSEGNYIDIEVEANNRDQAARLAEKRGFEVCSVNMVG